MTSSVEEEGGKKRATCLGYASRLSPYEFKGVTGLPEVEESERSLRKKLAKLVALVRASESIVALTGAGISTAAGIPDFRGLKGIWTLEEKKKEGHRRKKVRTTKRSLGTSDDSSDTIAGLSFEAAVPTQTHMGLVALEKANKLQWLATQNVDGLHFTSGFPRRKLAVLHGCVFTERCRRCDREYLRDYDVGGISFKPTGRFCETDNSELVDTILDWDDDLPDKEWDPTAAAFLNADLALCLGTSLRITPAADLPLTSKQFVIVNLQKTPLDNQATLVIRAKVDTVITHLLNELNIPTT